MHSGRGRCATLSPMEVSQREDVAVTGIAAGGEGVGRLGDGRAVFVRGALPGERVTVAVRDEKARFARAELAEVLEAAPERVVPPCPRVADGCGGCDGGGRWGGAGEFEAALGGGAAWSGCDVQPGVP